MDAAAYYSSFDPRIFEFFKIRAVETSIPCTAVSVRKVHHGDWLGLGCTYVAAPPYTSAMTLAHLSTLAAVLQPYVPAIPVLRRWTLR